MQELRNTAGLTLRGADAIPELLESVHARDPAVRYWAFIGIGNLGTRALSAEKITRSALKDESPSVKIAAARALCHMNHPEEALPVLVQQLSSQHEWVRLNAAIVLDEIDEQARPVIKDLQAALKDKQNK